jgi:hypothetical protein
LISAIEEQHIVTGKNKKNEEVGWAVPRIVQAKGNYFNVVLIPKMEKNYEIINSLWDALNEEKSDGIESSDVKEE